MDVVCEKARNIAIDSLHQCTEDGRILASLDNFSDYWARDTFWACFGFDAIGEHEITKNSFTLFLDYQQHNGKIPRKIELEHTFIKYVFKKHILRKFPKPIFSGLVPFFPSMDDNSLLIIALDYYVWTSGDLDFTKQHLEKIKKAIDWYGMHMGENGLIKQYFLSDWMDTVFKNGTVLYVNVLYCRALACFASLCERVGEHELASAYARKSQSTKEHIQNTFWNGKFLSDQAGNVKNFDVAANALACFFGIASSEQAKIICENIWSLHQEGKLLPNVAPKYPWWKINPLIFLLGMQDYHNGISWLWIDLFAAGALYIINEREKADEIFKSVCSAVTGHGIMFETYFLDGRPFKSWLWKSASPFAWNAGIFIYISEKFKALTKEVKNEIVV